MMEVKVIYKYVNNMMNMINYYKSKMIKVLIYKV